MMEMVPDSEVKILPPDDHSAVHQLSLHYWSHLTFLGIAVGILLLSFLMEVSGNLVYLPGFSMPLPESCSSKIFLGIACPACGLTRAFISISHGQFTEAWQFNPSSFVVYLLVAVQIPWQALQLFRIHKGRPPIERFWIYLLPAIVFLFMVTQWVFRVFA
ncbi:MAG: DUF2752 domain-containing protein [Planctomycetota bacterium]